MSTVKAVNFQHPSATQSNLVLAADGTVSGGLPSANRNLLYNGAMQVAQRGTSTAGITAVGYNTADRWQSQVTTLGTWTQSIENDAPTGSGFRKSLKMLCTTADASPAAGDYLSIRQTLEGQDLQRIRKGTAAAEQLAVSFWVKSNVAGTYVVRLKDDDNSRNCSASYTVSASATWEQKRITFPADTTGALDNDNAGSMFFEFLLGVGSSYSTAPLQSAWGAEGTAANIAAGQTNLAAAINNYWQVTGVQLEVGPVASAFEFKSFGQELRECQRYYWRFTGPQVASRYNAVGAFSSTTNAFVVVNNPVPLRSVPSAVEFANLLLYDYSGTDRAATVIALVDTAQSVQSSLLAVTVASGGTQYRPVQLNNNSNVAGYLGFSAEL